VLGALESQVRERAAVVVVCEDTQYYANPSAIAAFFREGKPMVDRLLNDPSFRVVSRFRVDRFPIAVLERQPGP
jgi:hypothetical protein